MGSALLAELRAILVFLNRHPGVRARIRAPRDKTIVYSGGLTSVNDVFAGWKMLGQAKAREPGRYDYVTLEERLRALHVAELGETIFEHANRISESLKSKGAEDQSLILWRALSGLCVRGARATPIRA